MAEEVSIPRQRIADGSLPPVCIVCGKEAGHRRFPGVEAPTLVWLILSPGIGLLAFWVSVLKKEKPVVEGARRPGLPFCDRHRNYWPRRGWFIVLGVAYLVVIMVVVGILSHFDQIQRFDSLMGVFGCSFPLLLIGFLVVHFSSMRATGGNRESVTISGANEGFIRAMKGM